MNKVQLKAKVKCDCEEYYLELLQSFDGEIAVYKRMCYKCGKWWTYTKRVEREPKCIHNDNKILYIGTRSMTATDGTIINIPFQEEMMPGLIFLDSEIEYLYMIMPDGTLSRLC